MTKENGFKMPNAFIVVFAMMVIVAALTYIIPAGRYEMLPGTKVIDPASFHYVASTSTTPWGFVNSIYGGMRKSAAIILFTFLVGGYFFVLIETKAVDRFVGLLVRKLGDNVLVIVPIMMVVMSVLGAVGIMANPVVAVVPVGMILAERMHLDKAVALGMTYVAAYTGYAMSPVCPMTLQTAQKIAEVPLMSGFGFRTAGWAVLLAVTIIYVLRYASKVRKNPECSVLGSDFGNSDGKGQIDGSFGFRDFLILAGLLLSLGIYIYGSFVYRWGLDYMAGAMFCAAAFGAFVSGMGAEGFVRSFLQGTSKMCFSALLIGLATSISIILSEGQIMHTIINYVAMGMEHLPDWAIGPVMFYANIVFNFFVSSGSGQAAIVMPIMAPLADVVGVTRQMAICAFQYGDGLSNSVFPTNGVMMASIAIAGIRFDKWLKWMAPLFMVWVIVATLIVIAGVALGVD